MSKDWTPVELETASKIMKVSGQMSYEEFCEALDNGFFTIVGPHANQREDCKIEQS